VSADKARKEAAAQRQLDAAIRMTLHDEDELAIHSVVAAAYGVLRGLKKKKHGRREFGSVFSSLQLRATWRQGRSTNCRPYLLKLSLPRSFRTFLRASKEARYKVKKKSAKDWYLSKKKAIGRSSIAQVNDPPLF
jgi:hypothetical protein